MQFFSYVYRITKRSDSLIFLCAHELTTVFFFFGFAVDTLHFLMNFYASFQMPICEQDKEECNSLLTFTELPNEVIHLSFCVLMN